MYHNDYQRLSGVAFLYCYTSWMKSLFLGIALVVLVGLAGFFYRNAVERPLGISTTVCTLEAKSCPDGSTVGRVAPACSFAPCPVPNVTLSSLGIVFALPAGFVSMDSTSSPQATFDADTVAVYANGAIADASTSASQIIVRDYAIPAGETAAAVMHSTAISDASGAPASPSAFAAVTLGSYTYTQVVVGRFEGVVHVAYYLPRAADVLRFDAIDTGVMNWTDPNLRIVSLPANAALRSMLTTISYNQ